MRLTDGSEEGQGSAAVGRCPAGQVIAGGGRLIILPDDSHMKTLTRGTPDFFGRALSVARPRTRPARGGGRRAATAQPPARPARGEPARPGAAVPPTNWWNIEIVGGAGRSGLGGLHRLRQQREPAPPAPGLRRHARRRRQHLRLSVHRGRRQPAEEDRPVRRAGRERRREPPGRHVAFPSIRFPTRRSRSRTGSRAATRATSTTPAIRTATC